MDIQICPECNEKPIASGSDDFLCVWCRSEKDGKPVGVPGQIYSVQVKHYDDNIAPPDKILDIARVGGNDPIIFFDLLEYEERTWDREAKCRAQSGVHEDVLVRALIALGVPIIYKRP